MDVNNVVKQFIETLCEHRNTKTIIDMTNNEIVNKFQLFIMNLFHQVFEDAGSTVNQFNGTERRSPESISYDIVMSGNNTWNSIADAIDNEDILCIMASGESKFELERSGFILCLMNIDKDLLKFFKPAIDDLIEYDIGEEYRQYKARHANDKDVMINEKLVSELQDEDAINDEELLAEYFKTLRALGNFKGYRTYTTDEEKDLHDRLMRLYQRLYDKGK